LALLAFTFRFTPIGTHWRSYDLTAWMRNGAIDTFNTTLNLRKVGNESF